MQTLYRFSLFILLLLSMVTGSYAGPFPNDGKIGSGFGVQVKPERTTDRDFDKISQAGFAFIRFDMRWHEVEVKRGQYNFAAFDKFITKMRSKGLKAVIILSGANPLYSEEVTVPGGWWGKPTATAAPHNTSDINGFANFAAAAVAHFGASDIIWEIWNEPDQKNFWPPHPDGNVLAKLVTTTCAAIRRTAPNADVIAPAIAGLPDLGNKYVTEFLTPLMQSPASKCMTALSIHPYRWTRHPETMIDDYKTKVIPFVATATPKGQNLLPIVSGEWGYTTAKSNKDQHAAYVLRTHLVNLLSGIPLSIWYEWRDSHQGGADDAESHFGIEDYDGHDKKTTETITGILPLIKNATIMKQITLPNKLYYVVLIKQPAGSYQLITWIGSDTASGNEQITVEGKSYRLSLTPALINVGSANPVISAK